MKTILAVCLLSGAAASAIAAEDFLDSMSDHLTASSAAGTVSARLSGTLDLEGYSLPHPPPGLFYTEEPTLFVPRLALFLDTQLGDRLYFFAQLRVDRGFDAEEDGLRGRLDEYALRFSPRRDLRFSLQAGKFATVVGNWVPRHGSWENPFITAPLPYENLTGIWDQAAARSSGILLAWSHVVATPHVSEYADKDERSPIIWGPSYATGLAVIGEIGRFNYALECKNASLSARPSSWDDDGAAWRHPTVSARVGLRPSVMWNLGISASTGTYLRPSAATTLAPGFGLGDYRETVLAQDASFAWHYWQVWFEAYETRFEIPRVGNAETFSYYAEVKYKFTPQLFGAVRWNQQWYGTIPHGAGRTAKWGRDTWRFDVGPGYRFTSHVQLKLQYSLLHEEDAPREFGHTVALQLTARF